MIIDPLNQNIDVGVWTTSTIVAEATPSGSGGVSIVRLSGPDSFALASRTIRPHGSARFEQFEAGRLYGADIVDRDDRPIDSGLVVLFRAPRSFTGEDVVEFHLHGNPIIVRSLLSSLVSGGAEHARAGEFSRRAFLNGKLDLAQVEALARVVATDDLEVARAAALQLRGSVSRRIDDLRSQVLELLALLETELDFVEEGYRFVAEEQVLPVLDRLADLVSDFRAARRHLEAQRPATRVGLFGLPNAGKSSLFNALLGFDRSIVSDRQGTTRDYVTEDVLVGDRRLSLLDTAGLRETNESIERSGVDRAFELAGEADLFVWLVDLSDPQLFAQSISRFREVRDHPGAPFLLVGTKSDRCADPAGSLSSLLRLFSEKSDSAPSGQLAVSTRDHLSLGALLDLLVRSSPSSTGELHLIVSDRQARLVDEISRSLDSARLALASDTELLSYELRALFSPLSALSGSVTNEDVLDRLFSGFCVGK